MGAALVLLLVGLGALAAGVLIGRYYVPDDRQLRRTARHSRAYIRALSHLIARDHEAVVSELRAVVEENVDDVEPYFALGAMFRSRGEHERAIRVHQALALRERERRKLRQRAMYELGLDFRAAGMPRRATRAMEEVVLEEPNHEGALRVLAVLYEEQARFNEAAGLWQRLGRRRGDDTRHREHHLLVAAAQAAVGRDDLDSARQLLKAAQKHEESAHFYAAAAALAAARHNHRGARDRLKQALVAEPGLVPYLLANLLAAEQGLAAPASDKPRHDRDDLDEDPASAPQLSAATAPQLPSGTVLQLPAATAPQLAATTEQHSATSAPQPPTPAALQPAAGTASGRPESQPNGELPQPGKPGQPPAAVASAAMSSLELASAGSPSAPGAPASASNVVDASSLPAVRSPGPASVGRASVGAVSTGPASTTAAPAGAGSLVASPRGGAAISASEHAAARDPGPRFTDSHHASPVTAAVLATLAEVEAQTGPRLELSLIRAQLAPADAAARAALAQHLTARFPDSLAARVATARLALAGDDPAAVRGALSALASDGGALAWALHGRWQCAHCGHRPAAFSWRCSQCRRWATLRMETGMVPPPVAPRERRSVPRRADAVAGPATDDALPVATLDPGLDDHALAAAGSRRSLLGRVGGWVAAVWRRDGS